MGRGIGGEVGERHRKVEVRVHLRRPREPVGELRVPAGDGRVRERHVEVHERPRRLSLRQAVPQHHLARDLVPQRGGVPRPGPGGPRLGPGALLGGRADRRERGREVGGVRSRRGRRPELVPRDEEPRSEPERDRQARRAALGVPAAGAGGSGAAPGRHAQLPGGVGAPAACCGLPRLLPGPDARGREAPSAKPLALARQLAGEVGGLTGKDGAQHRGGGSRGGHVALAVAGGGAERVVLRAAHQRI